MAHRQLDSGTNFSAVNGQLSESEVLVAHWLRDPLNNPEVTAVLDEQHFDAIIANTEAGYYNELTFFASTNPTKNPYDYKD